MKITHYLRVTFFCVVMSSCSTPHLKSAQKTREPIREAIETNNRQKLVAAIGSVTPGFKRKTAAKTSGEFSIQQDKDEKLKSLSRAYDFFLENVHDNLQKGLAHRDPEKVLLALSILSRLNSAEQKKPEGLSVRIAINNLLENNLEKFESGDVNESDYRQLEEDYDHLMTAAKEYFVASAGKQTVLNQLVMQKTQSAALITSVIVIVVCTSVVTISSAILGINDNALIQHVILLDTFISSLCQGKISATESLNRIKEKVAKSYQQAFHRYCEKSKEGLSSFKKMFSHRNPGYWGLSRFCYKLKLFPELCPGRQWFCEVVKKTDSCLKKKGVHW